MSNQDTLFETIDENEYSSALAAPEAVAVKRASKPKYDLSVRTQTAWFKLPTSLGACTVPLHEEIQAGLTDEEKQYRKGARQRMIFEIGEYSVCRDCYINGADIIK